MQLFYLIHSLSQNLSYLSFLKLYLILFVTEIYSQEIYHLVDHES